MKGNGNGFATLLKKLFFYLIPSSGMRTKYLYKHRKEFRHIGDNVFFQPRKFPSDPELISFGNNVRIASEVSFINHDGSHHLLNKLFDSNKFKPFIGCIEIGNNVLIGSHTLILPNVKIGNNVIVGAGSIVSKDIPDNSVFAGIPARKVGNFDDFVNKRIVYNNNYNENLNIIWENFNKKRK